MKKENGVTIVAMIVIFIAAIFILGIIGNLVLGRNNSYIKDEIIERAMKIKNSIVERISWQSKDKKQENNTVNEVIANTTNLNEYINNTSVQNSSWY